MSSWSLLNPKLPHFLSHLRTLLDAAYDMSKSHDKGIKELKASEGALKEQVALLESRARALKLKFRGLPELPKINNKLIANLSTWLAMVLKLDEGIFSTINSAYRVGSVAAIRPNYPRDIVVQFQYAKAKDSVLQIARHA